MGSPLRAFERWNHDWRHSERGFPHLEDPSAVAGSEEESLLAYKRVRDKIRDWVDARFGDGARLPRAT